MCRVWLKISIFATIFTDNILKILRYDISDAARWDDFVRESRNGTFLFMRGYMDYHSDRFADHSLLFVDDKGKLVALLPANEARDAQGRRMLCSHQGLTYGGLVLHRHRGTAEVLQMLTLLADYAREQGFCHLVYKPVPSIYHRLPSQDDLYALWRQGWTLSGCNISATVDMLSSVPRHVSPSRRHHLRLGEAMGWQVEADAPLADFWPVMVENLRVHYGAAPVHSLEEMQLLQSRFPHQIRCYLVRQPGSREVLGGAVLYELGEVVHVQYGHDTPLGRQNSVMDFLYLQLQQRYEDRCRYFDFGTSNEEGGRVLNETLIAQKEGFGAHGVAYPTYSITL